MPETCNSCGRSFDKIGQHWARSSCPYYELTEKEHEIFTGLLMGDASIHEGSKNPFLQICMITEDYLEHIDSIFGSISTGVSVESRKTNTGNKVYRLNTRCLPEIKEYRSWYDGGGKTWPSDIELTPTVLKHFYCCDGNLDSHGSAFRLRFAMSNERKNKEKVEQMFERVGFNVQSWVESERKIGGYRCAATFSRETSEEMLEYMGSPPPGFEYKWGE